MNPLKIDLDNIYCLDSFDGIKCLEDNSVDLVVTSPPYNFSMGYDEFDDKKDWDKYFEWVENFCNILYPKVKFGGRVAINIQPLFSDFIPSHHIYSQLMLKAGFLWRNEILWEKNNYNCKYTAWGSWKSSSNPYLKYTWEFIEIFSKGQNGRTQKGISDLTAEEFKTWTVAKWSVASERKMKEYGHPAMFPEEIPRRIIKLFSYVGDTILDPFNGVGTTTLVSKKLNRRYIGFDLSESYCNKAVERLASV